MCATLSARALNVADLVIARASRLNMRSRRGERRLARTIHDPRCAWLATVGCLDPAVLSLRRARRFKKSLVLVRMFAGAGRNVQRTAVIRCAVFRPLATMAKTMGECAPHASRVHGNRGGNSFTMASAHERGLDRVRRCSWRQSLGSFAV